LGTAREDTLLLARGFTPEPSGKRSLVYLREPVRP